MQISSLFLFLIHLCFCRITGEVLQPSLTRTIMDDDVVDLTAFESISHGAVPPSSLRPHGGLDSQRRADDIKRRIAEKRKECDAARDRYRQLSKELKDLELALDSIHSAASRSQTDWGGRFDWSDRVDALLKQPFRLPAFRPHQAEIINAALAGRDVLVVLPTGGASAGAGGARGA